MQQPQLVRYGTKIAWLDKEFCNRLQYALILLVICKVRDDISYCKTKLQIFLGLKEILFFFSVA